jgi:hypothetical protein
MTGNDERKHEARDQAHEAGVEGASKMTEQNAREAAEMVREGADPQEAKESAKKQ